MPRKTHDDIITQLARIEANQLDLKENNRTIDKKLTDFSKCLINTKLEQARHGVDLDNNKWFNRTVVGGFIVALITKFMRWW